MRVGFLCNQLDNRGTGNALFEYAYYNEKLLGNKSFIYTFKRGDHNAAAVDRFGRHFPIIVDPNPLTTNVDIMYHIKSGEDDGIRFPRVRYAVHAVFNASQRHGDRYAAVSEWLGERDRVPWVPHIVSLPYHTTNLRQSLGIPDDAVVFGRHGGADTFDIHWAWDTVKFIAEKFPNKYFLFMNTEKPSFISLINHPNIIFLKETASEVEKRKFINTCDAMIHARSRGETFGISVGEFAICGKPVITYGDSHEKAHLIELEKYGVDNFYYDSDTLYQLLVSFDKSKKMYAYTSFYPEKVMEIFQNIFLK